jgi:ketosteroid isomerase-like protein
LGAAPQAALFGPSPVARAGGRCLDVVRLLRITTASPSVEATSMRCQAVLEALRGRFDVSRSMLASSRVALEELGLRHGLLETDLFAGIVELIAGDPAAAVAPLRAAYEGLGTLGVGADAGQAAALLATALLAQGEMDEAELVAAESEALAGQNLKTAIAWRIAKASVLAARDAVAEGVALAQEAVEIASATDLVLDHADACVVLADLCEAAGDAAGAGDARANARRLYDAKGATVPAERLTAVRSEAMGPELRTATSGPRAPAVADGARTSLVVNLASRVHTEVCAAINRRDGATQRRLVAPDFVQEDRRPLVGLEDLDRRGMAENHEVMLEQGYEIVPPVPIAVRGDRFALALARARTAAGDESVLLALSVLDDDDRIVRIVVFDEHALDSALDDLDARYLAREGAPHAAILRLGFGILRAMRSRDWEWFGTNLADGFRFVDHQQSGFGAGDVDDFLGRARSTVESTGALPIPCKVFAADRAALVVALGQRTNTDGGAVSEAFHIVVHADEHGRLHGMEWFDDDDFDVALARLDELGTGVTHDEPSSRVDNATTRAMQRVIDLCHERRFDDMRTLLADEFVRDDHRHGVAAPTADGPDEFVRAYAAWFDVGFDHLGLEPLAVRGERVALARLEWTSDDGRVVRFLGLYETDDDGRFVRGAHFEEDDLITASAELEAAYTRLQELGGAGGSEPPFANLATEAAYDFVRLVNRGDLDALRARIGERFTRDDHRRVTGQGTVAGRAAMLENLEALVELRIEVAVLEIVATRGDLLALTRLRFDADGFRTDVLEIVGVDQAGAHAVLVDFDDEDLGAALAELDARYLAGEGTAHADVLRAVGRFAAASQRYDTDALRELLTPDFEIVDHTRFGMGREDRERFLAVGRRHPDLAVNGARLVRAADARGRAALALVEQEMVTEREARYERRLGIVFVVEPSGLISRMEWFDAEDYTAARIRFEELGAPATTGPALENTATVVRARLLDLCTAGRWDEVRACLADDYVLVDRRTVTNDGTVPGADAMVDNLREIFGTGVEFSSIVAAIRGDRLMIARHRWVVDGFEIPVLMLVSVDADGRCDAIETFDQDDLDAAIDALNARYFAGEGVEHADMGARSTAWAVAVRERDWDGYVAMLADDFVAVSHFRFGFELGAAEFVGWLRATETQMPGLINVPVRLDVVGRAVLASNVVTGTTPEGNEYEWRFHLLSVADTRGRLARSEFFEDDQYEVAVARLHELGASRPAGPLVENDATRAERAAIAGVDAYLHSGGSADLALAPATPDFVVEDRRPIVGMPQQDASGVDAVIAAMLDQGYLGVTAEVVAVRGDRLGLTLRTWLTASGDETRTLAVTDVDGDGLVRHQTLFAEADLDGALAELDARFLAGEGAGSLPVLAAGVAWIEASRNHDVDALRAVVAPDLVCVDHQPLGFGTLDRDGIIAATRLRFEVSSDDVVIVRSVQVDGPVLLARHYSETATAEGNRYEREAIYVLRVDADGRIDRWDVYGEDQHASALARFRELAAPYRGPVVANAGSRTIERLLALLNAGDHEGVSAVDGVAEHVVRYDRRKLVSAPPIEGAEAYGVNAIGFLDVFDTVDPEVVAVRGERLALVRLHFGRAPDFVLPLLCLYEFDVDGRIAWEADYDDDDLPHALRELDDRYVAGEGAPHERILRIGRAFADVNDERDFDGTVAMLSPDFVMADHTRLGFGEGGPEYFDAANRSRADVADDEAVVVRTVDVDGDALLAVIEGHRITPDGSDYLWTSVIVFQIGADDRVRRAEYYDEDRYRDAVVRLHELAHAGPLAGGLELENAATRVEREVTSRIARGETHLADIVAPDFRHDDRRSIVNLGHLDRAGQVRNLALMREQGYVVGTPEALAIRGERLWLSRRVARTPAGDESPVLSVNELDESGRWSAMTFFDDDALAVALDDLDDRYAAGEGAEHAYTIRRSADLRRAMTAHDWAAIEALVGDDFSFHDHRPLGLPDADRAGYVAAMVASAEQTPGAVLVGRALEICGDVTLTRTQRVGATTEGFEYDWEQLAVGRWAAGRLRLVELFAVADETAARARFAELTAPTLTPYVDNDTVRTVTRAYWLRRFVGPEAAGHLVSRDIAGEDLRRTVSMPEFHGRAGFAQAMDATDAVFSDGADIVPLAVRGDRLALVRDRLRHGDDELEVLNLWETDEDGRLAHATLFDPADFADAVHLLDVRHAELRAHSEPPRDPHPPEPAGPATAAAPDNPAVQAMVRLGRLAWTDLDAASELFAPDASGTTHQTGPMAGSSAFGRDGWRNVVASFVETYDEVHFEPRAVRGQRLALLRFEFVSDGFESAALVVVRLDGAALIDHIETYDEADLARALVDLNARYRSSGEAAEAELDMLDAIDAMNRRDWDALTTLLDPDLVAVDHQPLGFEPTDRAGFVGGWMGGLVAMMPDAVTVVAEVRGLGSAVFGHIVTRGDTVDGNEYEWDSLVVGRYGRGARLEFFPTERRADALAQLDEWGAAPEPGRPDNAAARTMVRWYGLSRAGDAAADALTSDDIAMVDRRRGVSLPMIEGRDAFNEAMAATDAVFAGMDVRPLAVRGERLALINVLRSNDGFELSTLVLVEAATDGRVHRVVIFEESDLVAALTVLDRRHVATAVDLLPVEANQLATYAALNRRDWPAFTAGLVDDLAIVDHRRIGFPPGRGADALTGELQGLVAQVPDVVAYVTAIRARGRTALVTTHQHGTATVGGHAIWDFHTVVSGDAEGRVVSLEYFDADRWDDARARFDESPAAPAPEPALGVIGDGVSEAFARRDWEWIRTQIAEDIELRDLRSTVSSHVATGADAVIELLRGFADVGFVTMRNELLEARGTRLPLFRRTYRTEAGFELIMLALAERNDAGLIAGMVLFDADDLDAARAELDRRAAEAGDR